MSSDSDIYYSGPYPNDNDEEIECEYIIYDAETSQYICADNGIVISDRPIDQRPEWRMVPRDNGTKGGERSGGPTTMSNYYAIGTIIGGGGKGNLRDLRRVDREIKRPTKRRERNLASALNLMKGCIGSMNLNSSAAFKLKEAAAEMIKMFLEKDVLKRRLKAPLVAIAIIEAANNLGINVKKSEVLDRCQVTHKDYWNAKKTLIKKGISLKKQIPGPGLYIDEMSYALGLKPWTSALARRIAGKAKELGLTSGKDPRGFAAASLYVASIILDDKRTQKEISESVDITEVMIRNRYRDIVNEMVIVAFI